MAVSAIVLSYRRQEFLQMALDSLLNQSPRLPEEIILLTPVARPGISGLYADRFHSKGVAFRTIVTGWTPVGDALAQGVVAARGDVVAPLDDDDRWEPRKTLSITDSFGANPDLVFLHNGSTLVNHLNQPLSRYNVHRCVRHPSTLLPEGQEVDFKSGGQGSLRRFLALEPTFNNSSLSLRCDALTPWIDQLRRVEGGEDGFLFYCGLVTGGTVRATTDRLTRVTVHGGAATATPQSRGTYDARLKGFREFVRRNIGRLAVCRELVESSNSRIAAAFLARETERWTILERTTGGESGGRAASGVLRAMLQTNVPPVGGSDLILMGMALMSAVAPRLTRAAWMSWRLAW